jgi:hypothetical protein
MFRVADPLVHSKLGTLSVHQFTNFHHLTPFLLHHSIVQAYRPVFLFNKLDLVIDGLQNLEAFCRGQPLSLQNGLSSKSLRYLLMLLFLPPLATVQSHVGAWALSHSLHHSFD